MSKPTENEVAANDFDLKLFRLLRAAEERADRHPNWLDACAQLRRARTAVRAMMSDDDKARTS